MTVKAVSEVILRLFQIKEFLKIINSYVSFILYLRESGLTDRDIVGYLHEAETTFVLKKTMPANWKFYYNSLAPRIWKRKRGQGVDKIVQLPNGICLEIENKYIDSVIYPSYVKRDWIRRFKHPDAIRIICVDGSGYVKENAMKLLQEHNIRIMRLEELILFIRELKNTYQGNKCSTFEQCNENNVYFDEITSVIKDFSANNTSIRCQISYTQSLLNGRDKSYINEKDSTTDSCVHAEREQETRTVLEKIGKLNEHSIDFSEGKELVYAFRESMTFQEKKENTKLIDGCKPIELYMADTRCWYCREEVDIDNDPFWTFVGYLEDGTPYVALDSNLNEGLLCMKCVLSHWKLNKREDHPNWRKYLYLLFKKFEFQHMSLVYKELYIL